MLLFHKFPQSLQYFRPSLFCIEFARCLSLKVGDTATLKQKITSEDVRKFAELSGDNNPIHIDPRYIQHHTKFQSCIVHGAYLNSLVSKVIGTRLPGPGTVVVKQELNFPNPCYVGEEVEVTVKLTTLRKVIAVDFTCITSSNDVVLHGNAKLIPQLENNEGSLL